MALTKRVRLVTAYITTSTTALVGALNVLGVTHLTGDQVGACGVVSGIVLGGVVVVTQAITGTDEG